MQLDNIPYKIVPATGLAANVNSAVSVAQGVTGELRFTSDGKALYVFNGSKYVPVSLGIPYVAKTANYTVVIGDGIVDCTSGTFTVTLPTSVGYRGGLIVKNSGAGVVTVDGSGSETIDGDLTTDLYEGECLSIVSNNLNWIVI